MKKIIFVAILAFTITACGTMNLGAKLKNVEIGMTKHELVSVLGKSYEAKGGVQTPDGNIETITYYDAMYGTTYVFNLLNGKLVEWYEEHLPPQPHPIDNHNHRR